MKDLIIDKIKQLFKGADERNWQKVKSTFNDTILLDYSSMTGSLPAQLSPDQVSASWEAFLPGFDHTNHELSDFTVKIDGQNATAYYTGKADHFLNNDVWTVEGSYDTKLKLINGTWFITEQKFNFEKQSGNTNLPTIVTQRMQGSN